MKIKTVLLIPFQFACFYYVYFFIKLNRIFKKLFTRSGESRHPSCVSDLGRKAFNSAVIKYEASSRVLIDALYQVKKVPFYFIIC